MTKMVTKKKGNQVTENSQSRVVVNYVNTDIEMADGNLQQNDYESTNVYELNGNERVLLSSVLNGNVVPTNGAREIEIKLNDTQKIVQYVEKTPYTIEVGGFKVEVLKSEMTCMEISSTTTQHFRKLPL